MTDHNENKLLAELIGDEYIRGLLRELGAENESDDAKAQMLAMLSQNIMDRITLEVLKVLPESERATYSTLTHAGDIDAFDAFLKKHIPDLDRFIHRHAENEYESVKTTMHKVLQGL